MGSLFQQRWGLGYGAPRDAGRGGVLGERGGGATSWESEPLRLSFPEMRTAKRGTKMNEFVARFRTKPDTRFRTRFYSWKSQPEGLALPRALSAGTRFRFGRRVVVVERTLPMKPNQ